MAGQRLDTLLVARGLAESRERAQRLILAGDVLVGGHPSTKAGVRVATDAGITLKARPRYVSRGGEKLEAALAHFAVDVTGRTGLDIGASTGGFTDCLLQHGAAHVVAVDVGKGQLHWKLRRDTRVTVVEGVNARYLQPAHLGGKVPDIAAADVSFISLTKVLPAVVGVLPAGAQLITLIKPQFEAGREHVQKGGVVRDEAVRQGVVETVRRAGEDELGLRWQGLCESPLRGPAGNVEFLALWQC